MFDESPSLDMLVTFDPTADFTPFVIALFEAAAAVTPDASDEERHALIRDLNAVMLGRIPNIPEDCAEAAALLLTQLKNTPKD